LPETGTYYIQATTYEGDSRGKFELTLDAFDYK
jgi:hypothetical protein